MEKENKFKYIPNQFEFPKEQNYDKFIEDAKLEIKSQLGKTIDLLLTTYPPHSEYRISSINKLKADTSIYTGTGGNVYAYWRLSLLNIDDFDNKYKTFDYFKTALYTNLKILDKNLNDKGISPYISPSFYMGPTGVWAIGCVYYLKIQDYTLLNKLFENCLFMKDLCYNKNSEQEILYGYGGYLWSLVFLYQNLNSIKEKISKYFILVQTIKNIFILIINEGQKNKKLFKLGCLGYVFPADEEIISKNDFYLGAAHGILGNLFILIETLNIVSEINEVEGFQEYIVEIKESLDYIQTLQFDTGNFPSKIGKDKDELIHFCHGATGATIVYLKAYQYFNNQSYLNSALKSGNEIWRRGILLKGNSCCHGIVGSSFGLYSIYKITKNKEWLIKSIFFALSTFDKNIQRICYDYDDQSRKVTGVADSPYSLMEGILGCLSLYSDLLSEKVLFPGFEII